MRTLLMEIDDVSPLFVFLWRKTKKIPMDAWMGQVKQEVVYAEGSWVCNLCRRVGYQYSKCPLRKARPSNDDKQNGQTSIDLHENGSDNGGWYQTRRKKGRSRGRSIVEPKSIPKDFF